MSTFSPSGATHYLLSVPDRIVVATDLTDTESLLPHIVEQAAAYEAHVTLVHAILPANLLAMEEQQLPSQEQERLDRRITGMVIEFGAQLRAMGVSCDVVAEHGFASDVIRRQISSKAAGRLMMGTHGRGKFGRLVLGSVASELLRSIEIPIFAVGPNALAFSSQHARPKRILHPVSLAGNYRANAAFAIEVASQARAELTLLHVLDQPLPDSDGIEQALAQGNALLKALVPANPAVPVFTAVSCGEREERILEHAERISADWILVGVPPALPFLPFRESTAYKVMAKSPCPVLTCGQVFGSTRLEPFLAAEERGATAPARNFSS
ncbi:universal stress protein [Silvibacterium sp.]|uniref:universal stress protein n=1 Tax=Silvibacterium sp. TaxID=1964179 RepID=UPI0039E2ED7D